MIKFITKITSFLPVLFVFQAFSQNINPSKSHPLFLQNEITRIELSLEEEHKKALIYPENAYLDIYYPTSISIKNSQLDTLINPVGIRIRGNTSRRSDKKSFKIDFLEFGGGQVNKLKKLNLKPNNNDPSMIRESLSWMVYGEMNVPAARTSFIELYMNEEFMGVYQNIENIDDEFVDRRYDTEEGNLYKCTWGATLTSNVNAYDNKLFELKTNKELNDRSKLVEFIKLLNSKIDDNWAKQLEAQFDVDSYLRQLAVESMIGHWDGYSYNTNNYYLYENPISEKIHFIPYDLDNTWGIDWIGPDWGKEDVLTWYSSNLQVPLTKQILKYQPYFETYRLYLAEVLENWMSYKYKANSLFSVIEGSVKNDAFYSLDFGYSHDDFLTSLDKPWGKHIEYSINDYIDIRYQNTLEQLTKTSSYAIQSMENFQLYPNPCNGKNVFLRGDISNEQLKAFDFQGKAIEMEYHNGFIGFKHTLKNGIYFIRTGNTVKKLMVIQ